MFRMTEAAACAPHESGSTLYLITVCDSALLDSLHEGVEVVLEGRGH